MPLKSKPIADLIQIVSYGGSLDFDASSRPTADLVKLASYTQDGSRLVLRGISSRPTTDLIQICSYGRHKVVVAD